MKLNDYSNCSKFSNSSKLRNSKQYNAQWFDWGEGGNVPCSQVWAWGPDPHFLAKRTDTLRQIWS